MIFPGKHGVLYSPGIRFVRQRMDEVSLFVELSNSLLDLFAHTDGVALRLEDHTIEGITDEDDGQIFSAYKSGGENVLGKLAFGIDTETECRVQ